ncbi:MAG: histidine phosphatase family protein [Acidimicrobiaceae bacterium]|nr:histidine phosphatase family protein [Acidimicrobiaceae bacterium]
MLILVRHGRTAHNASRRLLGRIDVPLDATGVEQAQALGRLPLLRDADRVVSSPLQRAVCTAEALGPAVEVDPRWIEVDYGIYDEVPLDSNPEVFRHWPAELEWTPEGGESLLDVGRRVRAACSELWEEAAQRDVVVVTHVSPLKAAIAWALGVDDRVAAQMIVDVASISLIAAGRAGQPALKAFNDTHARPGS